MDKVSLLMLTVDRYELTRDTLTLNLERAGHPWELYVADNGSQDTRIIDWIRSLGPAVHILNRENQGVARAFNSLLKLANGPYYCLMGNDILMPENWLANLVNTYARVPRAGLAGIHCVEKNGTPTELGGVTVNVTDTVFGITFFDKWVFKTVGYFNEMFHPYGMEDSDLNYRVNRSGFTSFYLNGINSVHQGGDVGTDSPYRKMKDESLTRYAGLWGTNLAEYQAAGRYKIPADGEFIIDLEQYFNPNI